MFKNTKKRQANRLNFQQELNQKLHLLKQDTPNKLLNHNKNRQIVAILDEAVNQLKNPIFISSKQNSQRENIEPIHINLNSSITKIEQDQKQSNHISNLVSNPQIILILKDNYKNYGEQQRISLQNFIKKIYQYYFGISIREEEMILLKEKVRDELTTTDCEYLSLNALEIKAKKYNLRQYLQSVYISVKIEQKTTQIQNKNKRIIQQLNQKQINLKERQLRLAADEQDFQARMSSYLSKQKNINIKQKQLISKQKQFKKSIEQKTLKLYQNYLSQFSQKIKQTQKRLNNTQKNIKYKIQILQRRSQNLKTLIAQKNDIKTKKVLGENQAKIKLRKLEKQMELIQKKYQNQIQVYEKQQKDMLKSLSILEQKLTKSEKKGNKYKQRISQLEEDLRQSNQQKERVKHQCTELQNKLHSLLQSLRPKQQTQIKLLKQKTNRSSSKSKRKIKQLQCTHIINLYQSIFQCLNSQPQSLSHGNYQLLLQQIMKITIKQLPQLIYLLTSSQDPQNITQQPHYLILNISKIIINQFYFLNIKQQSKQLKKYQGSKFKSQEFQEFFKYSYGIETSFSIFMLFLEIYDWSDSSGSQFFCRIIRKIIQEIEDQNILQKKFVKDSQIKLLTSAEYSYFFIFNFYTHFNHIFELLQQKNTKQFQHILKIVISIADLLINMIKIDDECIFDRLIDSKIDEVILDSFFITLQNIYGLYNSSQGRGKNNKIGIIFEEIQFLEEFAEKISIFLQRFYYKYSSLLEKTSLTKKIIKWSNLFTQMNKSQGNKHSFVTANLKSISNMIKQPK